MFRVGFIRIHSEEDPGNNRKDCFQCVGCSTNQKPLIIKGESLRNHRQSKGHSLRTRSAELPSRSHEAMLGDAAPLILTGIPQPQLPAAILVDHEVPWADHAWMNDSLNPDEPYHTAGGSVIRFSAGLMHPSTKETIRHEMDKLTEELEAWGSGLVGEGFERSRQNGRPM